MDDDGFGLMETWLHEPFSEEMLSMAGGWTPETAREYMANAFKAFLANRSADS